MSTDEAISFEMASPVSTCGASSLIGQTRLTSLRRRIQSADARSWLPSLAANAKLGDNRLVPFFVMTAQIIQ
jgi:hypothetical protein